MRILVYGAGVQGCQLTQSGNNTEQENVVTQGLRGEWKAVIDQKGLTTGHAPAENNGGSDADNRCAGPRGCV